MYLLQHNQAMSSLYIEYAYKTYSIYTCEGIYKNNECSADTGTPWVYLKTFHPWSSWNTMESRLLCREHINVKDARRNCSVQHWRDAFACLADPNTHQKSLWLNPTSCNWCTSTEIKAKQCTKYEPYIVRCLWVANGETIPQKRTSNKAA